MSKKYKKKLKKIRYIPFERENLMEFNEKYVNEVSAEIYRYDLYPYIENSKNEITNDNKSGH